MYEGHLVLRPDGFKVWSADREEPTWIPRPTPTDGWRELVEATRRLAPRGPDEDTLIISVHPEVRFWVLWRTVALVALRYGDRAFDGAADLDAVRPVEEGGAPARRFSRVWLNLDLEGLPTTSEEWTKIVRARAREAAEAHAEGRFDVPAGARVAVERLGRELVVSWWTARPDLEEGVEVHGHVLVDKRTARVVSWGSGPFELSEPSPPFAPGGSDGGDATAPP